MPREELDLIASLQKNIADLKHQHRVEAAQKATEYEAEAKRIAAEYETEAKRAAAKYEAQLAFLKLMPEFRINDADVAFAAGGLLLHAHRIVLSRRSPIFKRMFGTETVKPKALIRIENTSCAVIGAVINFCYTAEITFTKRAKVLKVANQYEIDHLKDMCTDELIATMNKENLTEILRLSKVCDAQRLQEAASQFVKNNFDSLFPVVLADL